MLLIEKKEEDNYFLKMFKVHVPIKFVKNMKIYNYFTAKNLIFNFNIFGFKMQYEV